MKRIVLFLVIALLLVPVAAVNAQDALEVGVPIRGEITNEAFEVEYTFSATADSVVIIEMLAEDDDGFMNDLTAQLIVLASSGTVVVDTADNFTFSDAVLVTQLPADDDYTLIATREDGRSGDTEGEYTLILHVPDVLTVGDGAEGTAGSETGTEYFLIDSEEDFVLNYTKSGGDYNPEILVSQIDSNNSDFEDVASVNGAVTNLGLGDMPAGMYIVRIQEGFFDFYFDAVTADFAIGVEAVSE
jgi:hypothetical protein